MAKGQPSDAPATLAKDQAPPQATGGKKKKRRQRSGNKANKGLAKRVAAFQRGEGNNVKKIKDKKLQGNLRRIEKIYHDAAEKAARAEILLPHQAGFVEAEGMERTWRFSQNELKQNVDLASASKMFSLDLDEFGPYVGAYSRTGRHLAIAGKKGHVAVLDWAKKAPLAEIHLRETVRDICFLHNHTMFAAAQKKYVYIYDQTGMELHCLRKQFEVNKMTFLPYHFLLASVSTSGMLRYIDTSTGDQVAEFRTRLGDCRALCQNPRNAVIHLGHTNGTVTLWTPNIGSARVKLLCHRGPVSDIQVARDGIHMVTAGLDGQVSVWDLRKYGKLHSYYTSSPATSVQISDTGILALGYGNHVQTWKDALSMKADAPYLKHHLPGQAVSSLAFCPYEDVLGIGHAGGFESIVVPGAGQANYDSFEANPFANKKQRQESEVRSLLEKIQPSMITLDPDAIGTVDNDPGAVIAQQRALAAKADADAKGTDVPKKKARGRNRYGKRLARKAKNVIDAGREKLREKLAASRKEKQLNDRQRLKKAATDDNNPIARFF